MTHLPSINQPPGPRLPNGHTWCVTVTYQVERQLKLYVSWKFLISAATGAGVGTTLWMCKVDLAAMFGVLTFFL